MDAFVVFLTAVLSHKTPSARVSVARTVSPDSPLFEVIAIDRGQILLLTITAPYAVLSIQNHRDFFLCLQPESDSTWYLTQKDTFGFFAFGSSRQTIVEVIALKDTEFLVSCCFLDQCVEVLAGNSFSYRATTPTRTCFMATDITSQVVVSGILQAGTMEIDRFSMRQIYDPSSQISENFRSPQNFQILKFVSDRPQNLSIDFVNGNPEFRFRRVTNTTGMGVVGVSTLARFIPMSGEPPYPPIDPDGLAYALIGAIPVCIVALCAGSVALLARAVRERENAPSEETASSLYDEQTAESDTGDVEDEMDKKSASERDETSDNENPYQMNGDVCL
jgi:hypothetical protein